MRRRAYLASLAVAGLVSGCLGGGAASSSPTPGPNGNNANAKQPTPTPTAEPTPTATPTATATPSPTPTATASLGEIDEPALGSAILQAVDDARGSSLTHQGSLVAKLDAMAKHHSDEMAAKRTVAYVIDGESTSDRYANYDLNCRFKDNAGDSLLRTDQLEVIGATSTRGVTVQGAAEALVQAWLDDPDSKQRLLRKYATHVGIGVTIVTGKAYVALDYC